MVRGPLNLRQVEIFHALMLNGTTQRAAEVLHISQPGVSKAIQELERELGFTLFHRARKRLLPTAEARLYLREVDDSFASLSRLRSAAARIRDFGSGQIRIATLSALSTNIVPRALRRFRELHPGVSMTVQVSLSSTAKDLVLSSRFDLGLAADEIDTAGVDARPFSEFPAVIAVPADHPLCAKAVLTPLDLQDQDFIALSPEDRARVQLDRMLEVNDVTPRMVLETPFASTVCAMVQARLGCGLVNPLTAAPFAEQGVVLRPFRPIIWFRALLIRPAEGPASRIVETCIKALKAEESAARNELHWAWNATTL